MLGNRKKPASGGRNGAGTSEAKAIDPLRNLGEFRCKLNVFIRWDTVIPIYGEGPHHLGHPTYQYLPLSSPLTLG
ncbi:hypothetical protein CesoFtcFv8_011433 [Champsocephalus esox]|uniref:Uncharacterized protein n=1 Tax=Champsocephalus esox TaxID=159716 RepID=A0AAN8C118_9TELE|nr:hypothetical protein KUCAC02_000116 [Chaenocephalus aceratus]KAK5894777.1 hypothetical protein CesoFtcFv8_011433 [Champsocephalus esox]